MNAVLILIALAQVGPPPVMAVDSVIKWTPPKLNEDGTSLTDLKGYIFSVAPDGVDLNTGAPPIQTAKVEGADLPLCPGDECSLSGAELFQDLTTGSYRVWAQAYDLAGNLSKFSAPSNSFSLDVTIPNPPPGVKVEVRVIVEVRILTP